MTTPTIAKTPPLATGQLVGSGKRKDIQDILDVLEAGLEKTSSLETFERLRVYTTSLDDLDPLLTKRGISALCRYGFDGASPIRGRLALRCLCNALLLAEWTRQIFVDGNYLEAATELMKNEHPEDVFLVARLLLLCTYSTNWNFDALFDVYHIAEIINKNISRHAKAIASTSGGSLPSASASACSESLKLLYNLTALCPHRAKLFVESLLPILKMLNDVPILLPPLQPPVSLLVNSLVYLVLEDKQDVHSTQSLLFPQFDRNINVDRLVHILDLATRAYNHEEMDQYGSPLIQVLLRIAETAPPGPKRHLRGLLLPSAQDREKVLGKGGNLSARLLRLAAAPMAPHLRELVPTLLFELSDNDVESFVHNVGYGCAAGFLHSRGIQLPSSALEIRDAGHIDGDNVEGEGERDNKAERTQIGNGAEAGAESLDVNPITGQRRDMEPKVNIPKMTDEEKEREAERLFVLFERLRASGIIDVENPVAQAVREGRFEEVD